MQIDKKKLSTALIEAMNKEELHTSECAKLLNVKSCYISMAKSEKSWDAMGNAPWLRIEEWLNSRLPLKEFVIPEGEPIVATAIKKLEIKSPGEVKTLPETVQHPLKQEKIKKQNNCKSVKIILFQGELEKLQKRLSGLEEQNTLLLNDNNQLSQEITKLREMQEKQDRTVDNIGKGLYVLEDETLPVMRSRIEEAERAAEDAQEAVSHLVTIPKQIETPHIVLFQRNNYR